MPDFNEISSEIRQHNPGEAAVRKKYLKRLCETTGRNTVLYYSAWLQKRGNLPLGIDDTDMNGFMSVFKDLDRTKGLDLVLHTPGGILSSTEAIIHYFRALFGTNIRVIVPQLAMSAGTIVALSAKEIVMGTHSSLGPIDPQLGDSSGSFISAHAVVEEFETAKKEIAANPKNSELWKVIIAKYRPTFIGDCQKAVKWGDELAKELLSTGMFEDEPAASKKIIVNKIVKGLADHEFSKAHDRHFSAQQCQKFGLKIINLESNKELQDAVLSVHHASVCTMMQPTIIKFIENHEGKSHILSVQVQSGK